MPRKGYHHINFNKRGGLAATGGTENNVKKRR